MRANSENIYFVDENIPARGKLNGETTFKVYSENWLNANKNGFSPKTYSRYVELLRRVNMGIGHIALDRLAPFHLSEFYKNLTQDGANRRTGGGLSEKTVLHHHRLISVILKQATLDGVVLFNAADKNRIKQPKAVSKETSCLEENEVKRLITLLNLESPKWRVATLLLLTTGIRRGELLGLEWSDIDFKNGLIGINRSSLYVPGIGIITKTPKTKASRRVIKISPAEINILNNYRDWWRENNAGGAKRLFVQKDGSPMHPDSLTDWTAKFCEKHGFTRFTPHTLRHTNISLLIAAGVSIKAVSSRAGHNRVSTTTDIYTHSIKSAEARAAEAVGGLILGSP